MSTGPAHASPIAQEFHDLCVNHGSVYAAVIEGQSGAQLPMPPGTKGTTASQEVFFKLLDAHTMPAPGTEAVQAHRREADTPEAKPLSGHAQRRGNYAQMKGRLAAEAAEGRAIAIPSQNINLGVLSAKHFTHYSRPKFSV